MTEDIIKKTYSIIEKFEDPLTKNYFNTKNGRINVTYKEGHLNISIEIDGSKSELYSGIKDQIQNEILKIEGILSANIIFTSEKQIKQKNPSKKVFNINAKNILAIASGKGGVGKSTFAVNFAVALKQLGYNIGLLDADIYGPSIPRMMGILKKPHTNENKKLVPLESYGIKCMSIGFLIDVDTPAIWRGPMVMKALEQMFNGVEWGNLDYLIIDLPPGTGDAQLTLAQSSKLSGSIIISTPQDVALIDARKGIKMFNKVNVPVIGMVENMSYFICNACKTKHEIFSTGGAKKEAENLKTTFLGALPLDQNIRIQSDEGRPSCIENPKSEISLIFSSIAKQVQNILKN